MAAKWNMGKTIESKPKKNKYWKRSAYKNIPLPLATKQEKRYRGQGK